MIGNQDKYYTQLDKDLQQLAMVDWATFVDVVGEDAIIAAKVCILKSQGKSLTQIANKLAISKMQVRTRSEKCVKC